MSDSKKIKRFIMTQPLYHLETIRINKQLTIQMMKDHWPVMHENLWFGNLPYINFNTHYDLSNEWKCLNNYLKEQMYMWDMTDYTANSGNILPFDLVNKSIYLLKEYLKNRSFRDPLCSHYNPRLDFHVIHPGGTRQLILDLFHTGDVKFFYFNTRGHEFDFLNNMKKITDYEELIENYSVALVPDHGTLIPHILKLSGVDKLPKSIINTHYKIQNKLSNPKYKIYSNYKISYLEPWLTNKRKKSSSQIIFKKEMTEKNKLKATLLLLGNINYNDEEISVRHRGRLL